MRDPPARAYPRPVRPGAASARDLLPTSSSLTRLPIMSRRRDAYGCRSPLRRRASPMRWPPYPWRLTELWPACGTRGTRSGGSWSRDAPEARAPAAGTAKSFFICSPDYPYRARQLHQFADIRPPYVVKLTPASRKEAEPHRAYTRARLCPPADAEALGCDLEAHRNSSRPQAVDLRLSHKASIGAIFHARSRIVVSVPLGHSGDVVQITERKFAARRAKTDRWRRFAALLHIVRDRHRLTRRVAQPDRGRSAL